MPIVCSLLKMYLLFLGKKRKKEKNMSTPSLTPFSSSNTGFWARRDFERAEKDLKSKPISSPSANASDSSDNDDDVGMTVSQHLKEAIKATRAAKDTFDFYPWGDTPWDIKSDEIAVRRFTWLQDQDGYPLTRKIDTFYGTPHRAFDLLFI